MVMAGRFNRRIFLQSPSPTKNIVGELLESWTDQAEVWAEIVPRKAKEFFESDKISSEVEGMFRIRHRTDVKPDWRIRMDDSATSPTTLRTFAIVGIINPLDGRRELHLLYRELPSGEPV